jgi:hypothetical protein
MANFAATLQPSLQQMHGIQLKLMEKKDPSIHPSNTPIAHRQQINPTGWIEQSM